MIELYVLDKNLNTVGIIDSYRSLIWANRYDQTGDCELYTIANDANINLLQDGYYLIRSDDEMVCQIKKIEIDTSAEEGNYLIITGFDVKRFLDQRIIWSTMNCNGNVEDFIRLMVQNSICTPALTGRQMQKANGDQLVFLGDKANFKQSMTEQVSFKNVGEKVREYCQTYKWGYKMTLGAAKLWFQIYEGTDRTNEVIFSDAYENLSSTKYVDDKSNMGNVALVGGAGEGPTRSRNVYGYEEGVERFELFVDAKDIAKTITYEVLTNTYPLASDGGQGYIDTEGSSYVYKMGYINIQVVDSDQLTWLQTNFPGGVILYIDGQQYYQCYDPVIADLPSSNPTSNSNVVLRDIIYSVYLLNRGSQKVAEFGEKKTFEGSVIPDVTFVYKQDYFLGDLVTVENEYGISGSARIVEVVEVMDENGYRIEPKFEEISLT